MLVRRNEDSVGGFCEFPEVNDKSIQPAALSLFDILLNDSGGLGARCKSLAKTPVCSCSFMVEKAGLVGS